MGSLDSGLRTLCVDGGPDRRESKRVAREGSSSFGGEEFCNHQSLDEAKDAIFEYIGVFHNRRCRDSGFVYSTPHDYDLAH